MRTSTPTLHREVLTQTYPAADRVLVVWADRPYDRCPRCGQHVEVEVGCPVGTDWPNQMVIECDQQHKPCGLWLRVDWLARMVVDPADDAAVEATLTEGVTAIWVETWEDTARTIRERLVEAWRAVHNGDWDSTGSETEPGVYRDGGTLLAWDYGPRGTDDMIVVGAGDAIEVRA